MTVAGVGDGEGWRDIEVAFSIEFGNYTQYSLIRLNVAGTGENVADNQFGVIEKFIITSSEPKTYVAKLTRTDYFRFDIDT